MAAFISSTRRPSMPWSRLKPPPTDPLEAIGLPSKGDSRLLDFKTQESYYAKIVERYMQFCAAAGRVDDALDRAFASMTIEERDWPKGVEKEAKTNTASSNASIAPPAVAALLATSPPTATAQEVTAKAELAILLMSMRKLREGLLASARTDSFAQRAYIFLIRAALLTSTYESYTPALFHLLGRIHAATAIPAPELHEFVGYAILDAACRLGDFGEAYRLRARWRYKDDRVEGVVRALVHEDWVAYWRLVKVVDGYQRRMLGWAEEGIRKHALKCVGRSYLRVDKGYVEKCAGRGWEDLVKDGVGWERDGEWVVVRKVRGK